MEHIKLNAEIFRIYFFYNIVVFYSPFSTIQIFLFFIENYIFELKSIKLILSSCRETPVASPRRTCNVPTNKRVEMLRNCELELKRELAKTSLNSHKQNETGDLKSDNHPHNKRIDVLKYETTSAPNSPKSCRFSPRKTHVTNFINQNASPTEIMRRQNVPEPVQIHPQPIPPPTIHSPRIQLNGQTMLTPPRSPTPSRRRFRSHSPKCLDPDSTDSEAEAQKSNHKPGLIRSSNINFTKDQNHNNPFYDEVIKRVPTPEDLINRNTEQELVEVRKKPPLMTFRSVDMGNQLPEISYCPQSEPLKRKIYRCSSTFDKIQKSLDIDSGRIFFFFLSNFIFLIY